MMRLPSLRRMVRVCGSPLFGRLALAVVQPPMPCNDTVLLSHTACFTLKGIWDFEHVEREIPDVSKLDPNECGP